MLFRRIDMKKRNALILMMALVILMTQIMPLQAFAGTETVIDTDFEDGNLPDGMEITKSGFDVKMYEDSFPLAPHSGDYALFYRSKNADMNSSDIKLGPIDLTGAESAELSFFMNTTRCDFFFVTYYVTDSIVYGTFNMQKETVGNSVRYYVEFPEKILTGGLILSIEAALDDENVMMIDDIVLKAKYPNTVTYEGGTGSEGTAPVQEDVKEGDSFTVAENTFTKHGYAFTGWSDGEDIYMPGETYTAGDENVVLTAQWTPTAPQTGYGYKTPLLLTLMLTAFAVLIITVRKTAVRQK